jgi:hypothetical protein
MHEDFDNSGDALLRRLFGQGLDAPADDGFTDTVMGRIRRRLMIRKTVLTAAAVIGGLIAIGPAYELSLVISNAVSQATSGWSGVDWLPQTRILALAGLTVILAPVVAAILDE